MKKFTILAVLLAGALALSGCVQLNSDTVIEKDGSGTAALTMSVSTAVADALAEMQELDDGQSGDMDFPMFEDINQDDLDAAGKEHGVKIAKFERKVVDERKTLDIVMEFEDLEGLSYVMGKVMGGEVGEGMGIYDAGEGNFVLRQATYDFPEEPAEEELEVEEETEPAEPDPEAMQKQMALMGTLMGSISELDVAFRITVPGEIVSSNAPTVEGKTSIWSINSTNLLQQDQDMDPEIVFSGKGLEIEPLAE